MVVYGIIFGDMHPTQGVFGVSIMLLLCLLMSLKGTNCLNRFQLGFCFNSK